jgi:hypothetical protein
VAKITAGNIFDGSEDSMQRVTSLKTERNSQPPEVFLEDWRRFLQEHDQAPGTVKKYTQAVAQFLAWYEQEEQTLFNSQPSPRLR